MTSSRSDKIVRVKLTDTETNTHQIYLTTKREAEQRLKYVAYGEKFEYYPYRWFEVQCLWEVPSFWFLKSLSRVFKKDLNRHKMTANAMSLIVFIAESSFAWLIAIILTRLTGCE